MFKLQEDPQCFQMKRIMSRDLTALWLRPILSGKSSISLHEVHKLSRHKANLCWRQVRKLRAHILVKIGSRNQNCGRWQVQLWWRPRSWVCCWCLSQAGGLRCNICCWWLYACCLQVHNLYLCKSLKWKRQFMHQGFGKGHLLGLGLYSIYQIYSWIAAQKSIGKTKQQTSNAIITSTKATGRSRAECNWYQVKFVDRAAEHSPEQFRARMQSWKH